MNDSAGLLGGTRTRTAVGIVDQGVFTVSNLLLIAVVAHFSSAAHFGAFGIAYSSYIFMAGLVEATSTEALLIRASNSNSRLLKCAGCSALGAALVLALALGLVMIVTSLLATDPLRTALLLTALLLPGLITQDSLRRYFFAGARPEAALINDVLWLSIQMLAVLACVRTGHRDIEFLILSWAGTGNLAALVGLIQARAIPQITKARSWWKENRVIGISYAVEFLSLAGAAQAVVYIVAATSGLEATAGFRVVLTVFGLLNVAVTAARVVGVPELVRLRASRYSMYRSAVIGVSIACGGLALASGIVAMVLPQEMGASVFGASWALALPLILPLTIQRTLLGLSIGPIIGMRCLGVATASTRVRVITAVMELVTGSVASLRYGVVGAAYGIALASVLGPLLTWGQYLSSERSTKTETRSGETAMQRARAV